MGGWLTTPPQSGLIRARLAVGRGHRQLASKPASDWGGVVVRDGPSRGRGCRRSE